ncbi:hypothetical protein DM558_08705 [Entomomonas moraniae]|uniref:Roadblock/LAMTOR2 domain-containing protein n=1 Tax=Entomomonas moraniae TaxID=2213226 RepID=A0A3S9XF01_9GAMM|nr:roadblock/LC7 domain-containing protein [Entomomonas moraniae]AZS50856.1 hypothetical protein DM558_08705 [Entomomonas moraniae]
MSDDSISDIVQNISEELLSLLLTNVKSVNAAIISTADGFEVSSKYTYQANINKLSALSSSLSAIGSMATLEAEMGKQYRHVMIESDGGFLIVMDIPYVHYPMILCVVASDQALLARVIQQAKNVSMTLVDQLPKDL